MRVYYFYNFYYSFLLKQYDCCVYSKEYEYCTNIIKIYSAEAPIAFAVFAHDMYRVGTSTFISVLLSTVFLAG